MFIESGMWSNHLMLPPSPLVLNFCQHQGLFQWVTSLHQVDKVLKLVSASVLPVNIQGWFPLGSTGLISLLLKGVSRVFSNITVQKHQFFCAQPSLCSNSHIHIWLLEKTIVLAVWTFVGKVISLIFNTLSRFVTSILPRSKHLLILWLQSPSTLILEPREFEPDTVSTFFPFICYRTICYELHFLNVEF